MPQFGEIIKDLSPAVRPHGETLEGRVVLVQPLDPLVHGDALYKGTHGDDCEELWRYLPEGPFPNRSNMIVKGRNRDTAWFSMLDSEWPARKASFKHWLDAKNFDENGVQKLSLSAANRAVTEPGIDQSKLSS